MNLLEMMELYKAYRNYGIILDLCSIGINICVLLVLLFQNKTANKKIKRSFILYSLTILSTLIVEIISWYTLFEKDYLLLYKTSVIVDHFLIWIVPITIFNLIINIIEYKASFNRKLKIIYYLVLLVFGLLIFVPPIRNQIITFNDTYVYYKAAKYNRLYFYIESILILFALIIGLLKSKKIGITDTIIVEIFIIVTFVANFTQFWWSSTVGMLLMSFTLILLIGLTYQNRLKEEMEIINNKKIELGETKTKLLLAQIQPHFLYNTLSTLKFLCETSPKEASSLCDDFASYLRSNIDAASDSGLVMFEKELSNIEHYLKIEKARFGDRIKYVFDIEEKDFAIPVLSIQTIVENSVKKGICKKMEGGTITIKTRLIDNKVEIKVIDDGIGFDLDTYMSDGKNHAGLTNTKQRIDLINGNVKVESEKNIGTTVTVIVNKGEEE